jgi:alpha-glucosidase
VLLGENAISTIADLRRVYGAKGDEINLPMDFLYKDVSSLDAATFKARIDEAELGLDGLPPVFHFSNHDTSRQRTRFGDGVHDEAIAKITAAMTLTLRGTALMYYGEELGMADLPAEVLKDVPLGPKRKVADKRDPERSPMQWTDGPGAGFTTGYPGCRSTPTPARSMPRASRGQGLDARLVHRAAAIAADRSCLAQWRLCSARERQPKVLAYARRSASGAGILVLLNMSGERQALKITGWPGQARKHTPKAAACFDQAAIAR